MEPAELAATPPTTTRSESPFCSTVFGLHVRASTPIPYLEGGDRPPPESLRRVVLAAADRRDLSSFLPREPRPDRLFERRFSNGRPMLVVDRQDGVYNVWAPRHGRYALTDDGRAIHALVPRQRGTAWTRLLFAQVLPLAASLQGLECLHAGCVAVDGRAFALVASSGTGKSSVGLNLVARGAAFVTDDVLAVERSSDGIVVHPGAPVLAADPRELAQLPDTSGLRVETLREAPKASVRLRGVDGPLPLAAVYLLRRDGGDGRLELRDVDEPRPLLGARFLSYLTEARHLVRHLDVAAAVAASASVVEVVAPASASAADVAEAIASDLAGR